MLLLFVILAVVAGAAFVVAAAGVICGSVVTARPIVRSQLALADGVSLAQLPMHVLELVFGCIAV